MEQTRPQKSRLEICILAGGLSSRMGQDKSKLQLSGKTLLAHIRKTAKALNVTARTIRRDIVPRCGPLGGIYTATETSSADTILFLACDMPLISAEMLEELIQHVRNEDKAVFTWSKGVAGFPFVLRRDGFPTVEKLLAEKQFSIQVIAAKTHARKFRPGRAFKLDLLNVNTPEDWGELQKILAKKH